METGKRTRFRRRSGIGTGTTSLLVIFTIMCLATLAMLSLSTAASNRRIHQRGVQAGTSLAAAQGEAAKTLAEIDAALAQAKNAGGGEDAYYAAAFSAAEKLGCEVNEHDKTLIFRTEIDADNELVTELGLSAPGKAERYTILEQVSVRTGEWEPKPETNYWTGN